MSDRGFTLVEMVVAIAIAAVLVLFAIPSYISFIQNSAALNVTNQLSSAMNYARLEAIKRGVQVSVCGAQNNPVTTCGDAASWMNGWMVFVDANNNQVADAQTDYLKIEQPIATGVTITANTGVVSYDGSGYLSSTPLTMVIQPNQCAGNQVKTVSVSASGHLNIQTSVCPGG